jgi:hypothetical protein
MDSPNSRRAIIIRMQESKWTGIRIGVIIRPEHRDGLIMG